MLQAVRTIFKVEWALLTPANISSDYVYIMFILFTLALLDRRYIKRER